MFMCPSGQAATTIKPEYVGTSSNITAGTSHTFSAVPFGTAFSTRRVFVSFFLRKAGTGDIVPSSVTIAGVAATIVDNSIGYSSWNCVAAYADIPTGTSGDIVINWPYSVEAVILSVLALDTRMVSEYFSWTLTSADAQSPSIANPACIYGYVIMSAMATSNTTTGTVGTGGGLGTPEKLLETSIAGTYPMTLLVGRIPVYAEEHARIGYSFTGDQATASINIFVHA